MGGLEPLDTMSGQFGFARRLDAALTNSMTKDAMTVPALSTSWGHVAAPGRSRLIEDLWLARRTNSSVHVLMRKTLDSPSEGSDHTESAAVLVRRLMELLGYVAWLTNPAPKNWPVGGRLAIRPSCIAI